MLFVYKLLLLHPSHILHNVCRYKHHPHHVFHAHPFIHTVRSLLSAVYARSSTQSAQFKSSVE